MGVIELLPWLEGHNIKAQAATGPQKFPTNVSRFLSCHGLHDAALPMQQQGGLGGIGASEPFVMHAAEGVCPVHVRHNGCPLGASESKACMGLDPFARGVQRNV